MTANLCFQIEKHVGVLTIPSAAFRFHPRPEQVNPCDRPILEGATPDGQENQQAASADVGPSTDVPAASPGNRGQRYVWIADGELLSAVEVVTGLSDKAAMELVSGQLSQGQEVVVGVQTTAAK